MPAGQYTANLTGLTPDTEYTLEGLQGRGLQEGRRDRQHEFHHRDRRHKPPHWGSPDQAEADLQPTFGAYTIDNQAYEPHQAIGTLTLPEASGGNGPLTYALTPGPARGAHV